MTTLEQVIAAVQTLPPADRRSLWQWLQEQERPADGITSTSAPTVEQRDNEAQSAEATLEPFSETVERQLERFRKALKWIDEHRAEYPGQWVALEGDQLISHGPDALRVHREAKAAGVAAPFLERIVEQEGPYWGGWL